MTASHRGEVEDALAAWREAERALEEAPRDVELQRALSAEVLRLRSRYQRAVLASRGRIDQLEGASDETWERIDSSADHREQSQRLLRR
jgi:hypothetical protein